MLFARDAGDERRYAKEIRKIDEYCKRYCPFPLATLIQYDLNSPDAARIKRALGQGKSK